MSFTEAKKKLMDLVARREHSEKELREKLTPHFSSEIVDSTILWGYECKYIASAEALQTQLAEQLSKRGKGIKQINQKLQALGLTGIKADAEEELAKARKLALAKWDATDFADLDSAEAHKLKTKVMRFLIGRGYESAVVSSILKNDLKCSVNSEEEIYDEEF